VDADEGFVRNEQFGVYSDDIDKLDVNIHVNVILAESKEQALLENSKLPNTVKSNGDEITIYGYRDPDVLDTWFSSGLWSSPLLTSFSSGWRG